MGVLSNHHVMIISQYMVVVVQIAVHVMSNSMVEREKTSFMLSIAVRVEAIPIDITPSLLNCLNRL